MYSQFRKKYPPYNRAYENHLVHTAQECLGSVFTLAVNDNDIDIDDFGKFFVKSGVAEFFGTGHPKYILGMTTVEILRDILKSAGMQTDVRFTVKIIDENYWTGWALAWYQWDRNISFESIFQKVKPSEVSARYHPLHEADITKFVHVMDTLIG